MLGRKHKTVPEKRACPALVRRFEELEVSSLQGTHLHCYSESKHSSVWHKHIVNQRRLFCYQSLAVSVIDAIVPHFLRLFIRFSSLLGYFYNFNFSKVIKNNMSFKSSLEAQVFIKERMPSEVPTLRDIDVQYYRDLSWKGLLNICLMIFSSLMPLELVVPW